MYTSICCPAHFVLDRTSGKTQSEIFLEFTTISDAERFAQRKSGRCLGSRVVEIELVSSKEMLDAIFPRARDGMWTTREEIQNIITHAKTFKSPYTRKCPQRPIENFISILSLFPWANNSAYTASQVDLLFQGYTALVTILQWHIRKGKITALNTNLLRRLIIAGTNLTDFSFEQKRSICRSAGFYPEMANLSADALSSPLQHLETRDRGVSIHRNTINSVISSEELQPLEIPSIRIGDYMPQADIPQAVQNPLKQIHESMEFFDRATALCSTKNNTPKLFQEANNQAKPITEELVKPCTSKLQKRAHSISRAVPDISTLVGTIKQVEEFTPEKAHDVSPQRQWLLNARRAGIAVTLPFPGEDPVYRAQR